MTVTRLGSTYSNWAPYSLKMLILVTCAVSLLAGLFDNLFTRVFGIMGPQEFLSLDWYGFTHFYFWQPVSYLFVHHGAGGLSLFVLLELFFHMYILWMMGSALISHVSERSFLRLYFVSGIVAALAAVLVMASTGLRAVIVGAGPAVYAVITVWALLFPEQELMLFFNWIVKGKWIAAGLIAISLIMDLSHLAFVHMTTTLAGVLSGYIYATVAWDFHSPFAWTTSFDNLLRNVGHRWRQWQLGVPSQSLSTPKKAKVFDFRTGEALVDDDEFMDAMLEKVSKHGEKSLSRKEHARMRRISEERSESQVGGS